MKQFTLMILMMMMLTPAACASKEEIMAYYDAQIAAHQAKAQVEASKKPLLMIEAREGEDISFTGVKALVVYVPNMDNGKGYKVDQFKDPAYSVGTTVLGIAAGVAGIYLSGQNMVDLANAVGQHAGHNTDVGGDYTRDGSGKHVGDNVGGDQAGRDIHRDSHNDTDNSTHAGAPAATEE